jgi:Zn-dependent protease
VSAEPPAQGQHEDPPSGDAGPAHGRPRQHAWRPPRTGTGGHPPPDYPPNWYPPPGGYPPPPGGYPPPNYPPPGGYPSPNYPPPGGDAPPNGHRPPNGAPPWGGARVDPPQRTRPGGGQGAPRTSRRSLTWLIVVAAVVVILVRSHRITSTEVILFCALVPSVMLHEISHGLVALAFGDDTAKRAGRLSLNPLRHVTPWGTIIVPAITVLAHLGYFGWAKPVPVDVRRLRSPRNQGVLVALAGPFTNVLIAAIFGVIFYLAFVAGHAGAIATSLGLRIVFYAGVVNLWVACFNMFPIPPLDGSALVERLLPGKWWPTYLRFRPFGMLAILGAIVFLSLANVYPLQAVFAHIDNWYLRLIT